MKKVIVTSGWRNTDIDGLASAIAYKELLDNEGKEAFTVLPGPLNQSVTRKIRNWPINFRSEFPRGNFDFVLVDVSEPSIIDKSVDSDKIIEVYDHRFGFQDYWERRIGKKAVIDQIGACATLIWEQYKKRNFDDKISKLSANLLYTAIISNTLNFKASITDKRDLLAFRQLKKFTDLPKNWIEKYFQDQEVEIFRNPRQAIISDTKVFQINNKIALTIGQMELWMSRSFIKKNLAAIRSSLASFKNSYWFFTSPSIKEGKNYLYSENDEIKKWLKRAIKAEFKGNFGLTHKLWLRKEIIKKLQKMYG